MFSTPDVKLATSLVVAATAAAMIGCGMIPHTITLASGAHVEVIEEKSESFKDRRGVERGIFSVDYVGSRDFESPTALRDEMYEVFDFYRARIDRGEFTRLNLTPMKRDLSGGWEGRPFYLERRPSGRWIVL